MATGDLFGGLGFNSMFSLAGSAFNAQASSLSAQSTALGLQGTALGLGGTALGLRASALGVQASEIGVRGGAAADLFLAQGAIADTQLRAEGLNLNAAGLRIKAQGDLAEATNYDLASTLARKNKVYTAESERIQEFQLNRKTNMIIGGQRAGIAGAGLKESGSALDILSESATQGSLAKSVLQQQGLIQIEAYEEQAASFDTMSGAAKMAAAGEFDIANRTDQLATDTLAEGQLMAQGYQESSAFKTQQADLIGQQVPLIQQQAGIAEQQIPLVQQQAAAAQQQAGVAQTASTVSAVGAGVSGILGTVGLIAALL